MFAMLTTAARLLARKPFRRSHFHHSENALAKSWCCSSWIGTLFQLSWNRSPT